MYKYMKETEIAKLEPNDQLKLRMLQVKPRLPKDYTELYKFYHPKADMTRVKNVWLGRIADKDIVENFEKIADRLKNG